MSPQNSWTESRRHSDPSLLSGLLGGQNSGRAQPSAATPGWASLLDLNSDGNALDDILRAARKAVD